MVDWSISMMLAAIMLVGVILLIITVFVKHPSGKVLDKEKYRGRWLTITNSLTEDPATLSMAVIEADKLLDLALKERGVAGASLGERLKKNGSLFSDKDGVWSAHKLRNRVAHEHGSVLNRKQTNAALRHFKTALRDLGAL